MDRFNDRAMKRLLLLALFSLPAFAADSQNEMLQSALLTCRAQTSNANAWAQEQIAALTVELQKAQKRVQELEDAAKKAK